MVVIEKAKITRNLALLEDVHFCILERLEYLQNCDRRRLNKRNFTIKKEIEELEQLNLLIFHINAKLQANIHMGLKKHHKK